MQVFIYNNTETGYGVAVGTPSKDALNTNTILQIATKDTPTGLPFKIIESSEIPADRESWVVDDSYLDSGVGS